MKILNQNRKKCNCKNTNRRPDKELTSFSDKIL